MFSARLHDEGVFIAHVDHQGWEVGFAQNLERFQTAFAANQLVMEPTIIAGAFSDVNGLFQPDDTDVLHNFIKNHVVSLARVVHFNAADGYTYAAMARAFFEKKGVASDRLVWED